MRALITGGAGFIGSHLSELLLSKGWEVVVLDSLSTGREEWLPEGAELVKGDASSISSLPISKPDVVFHLAAEATVACSPNCWRNNVEATYAVAKWAKERDAPVVYASSAAVYGGCAPCREDRPFAPRNFYGATKAVGELILKGMGIRHASLRLFNVYGERMNPAYGAVVLAFTRAILAGEPPTIFGDGKAVRDYIYVGDVAKAFLRAYERMDEVSGMSINVGTGVPTSVEELFSLLKEISSYQGEPRYAPPREGDVEESVAATHLMEKYLLGREELTPLKEGLQKTFLYYKGLEEEQGKA